MTTQIVQLTTFDYGSSLSSVSLRHPTTDDEIATANTAAEVSADSGVYNCVFDKTSVIAAGTYRLRAVVSGQPVNRWVTLAGVDGEIAIARVERAAELDSAARVKLDASQPDYVPATAAALATAYALLQLTDTDVAAIKTKTDQMAFDEEVGTLDVNVKHYRGTLQSNGDLPQKLDAIRTNTNSDIPASISALQTDVDGITGYVTGILNRVGGFTGSGVNTILGFLRAMFRSDASTPSDMGGTATAANHSQQAIRVRGDEAWITGSGGGGGAGTGARTVTITVNDGATALQNAVVRMTEGSNTFTSITGPDGVINPPFNLDDATYTVSISKAGYSYGGTTLVVDGTETATYSMTQITITPSSGDFTTCYQTVYDKRGNILANQPVKLQIVRAGSSDTGRGYGGEERTELTNNVGVVQFQNVPKGAEIYNWIGKKGDSPSHTVPSTAGSTHALPSIVSRT
jgi:hypothetical protein